MGKIRTELHKARRLNDILEHEIRVLKEILRRNDISFNEKKKIASQIPKKITKSVGNSIRDDYESLEYAINNLDTSLKEYPELKQALIDLKKQVPKRYSVSKKQKGDIIDAINDILGENRSDR